MPLGESASGKVLGYLYQFERALFWLSIIEIDFVSVETEDDIVVGLERSSISQIFEQDKHSISDSNPFNDKSKSIWKTFAIWCEIQKNNQHNNFRLLYSTNKPYAPKSFIYKLAAKNVEKNYCNESVDELYEEFVSIASTLTGEAKLHAELIWEKYDEKCIKSMLSKIMINSDSLYDDHSDFKERVITNLRVSETYIGNEIYRYLLGWLVDNITEKWKNKEDGTIYSSDILIAKDDYISKFKRKPFIEQASSLLPLKEIGKDDYNENFVKQLSIINASEEQKIKAILNYQRANLERDRWAKAGTIPYKSDISRFEQDLLENWESVHELENIKNSHVDEIGRGKIVYLACQNNTEFSIASYKIIQKYIVQGSLHILANQLRLGWHPNWKKHNENG